MLYLKSDTHPDWLRCALSNLDAVLKDHAICEQKAAITALSFVSKYPGDQRLVARMAALASEEAEHLRRVAALCHARGLSLEHPASDPYAAALLKHARHGPIAHKIDRLLICALIEARSCERLKLLATHLDDAELSAFYAELWPTEAGHAKDFVELAVSVADDGDDGRALVMERLSALADAEAGVVERLPIRPAIH